MTVSLSPNTQAILLLTAPLLVGRHGATINLLTPREYKQLAVHLRAANQEPADLLTHRADDVLEGCRRIVDRERITDLVGRGFLLSQAIERWKSRAIWVVSRADATYPRRLKVVMRESAPAVLYGCGDPRFLDGGGLAVVGSRHVDDVLVQYTEDIGRLAAEANRTLVSGGARGIDQAAMRGALEAGGNATGVLANGLEQASMSRENRNLLLEGRLVLVSPYDPGAGFNVGNAMQRNKLIYAFSDAALVVNADSNKGGTWAGATEQLGRLHFVPVFVRSSGPPTKALDALRKKGAMPWPNPKTPEDLMAALRHTPAEQSPSQKELPLGGRVSQAAEPHVVSKREPENDTNPSSLTITQTLGPAEELFAKARELLLQLLEEPKREAEVAAEINVTVGQTRIWLRRLTDEGLIERRTKPILYVVKLGDQMGENSLRVDVGHDDAKRQA